MCTKSIMAVLAAVITLGLVALRAQAAPPLSITDLSATIEKSVSPVAYALCEGNALESYCKTLDGDDDDSDEDDDE